MGRAKGQTYDRIAYPPSCQPLVEQGEWMYDEIQQLKRDIKIGDMFMIPMAYYASSVYRQDDHSDNYPLPAYVIQKHRDVVTLLRHAPYGDIYISPSYARLYLLERRYGSGRRPLWE